MRIIGDDSRSSWRNYGNFSDRCIKSVQKFLSIRKCIFLLHLLELLPEKWQKFIGSTVIKITCNILLLLIKTLVE